MKQFNLASRLRSALSSVADGVQAQQRANNLGETIVSTLRQDQYAQEGSYFVTSTPTPGTGIALTVAAQAAFSATAPALLIRNTDAVGGKDIVMKRIRLLTTAAGAALTALESLIVVDTANRLTSGGATMTPTNAKVDSAVATVAQVLNASTAIVATAPSGTTNRTVGRHKVKAAIPVIGDVFSLNFGAEPTTEMGLLTGAAASMFAHASVPLVIPPQSTALVYLWGPGMTGAPTFEVVIEHIER